MTTITLDDRPGYRARIIRDECAEPPHDEGACPILRINSRLGGRTTHVNPNLPGVSTYHLNKAEDAARHFGTDWDRLERYLRIFHGATGTDRFDDGVITYVSYDPEAWREHHGLTTEHLAAHPDVRPCDMSEWRAYIEDDVYGIVIEQHADVVTVTTRPGESHEDALERIEDDDWEETWIEVTSVWGYYGRPDSAHIVSSARELLAEA